MIPDFIKNRKIFVILSALLLLFLIISGIVQPIVDKQKREEWGGILKDRIDYIESSALEVLQTKQDSLLGSLSDIKTALRKQSEKGHL